ncbi:MAG: hypothetical protein ACM3SR_06570 [Ignavibacteriales bacterium]
MDIYKRSVQTTITFPLGLYIRLIEKAKKEKVSLSEIVRKAVFREFEKDEKKSTKSL